MLELIPETVKHKFNSAIVAIHQRDNSSDSSSSGLLSPVGSPRLRRGHKRQLSLSSFSLRRSICSATAIVLLAIIGLWWTFVPAGQVQIQTTPIQDDNNDSIPIGQSEDRDGREVFWWEQFPRLHGLYRGRNNIVSVAEYATEQQANSPDAFEIDPNPDLELIELPFSTSIELEQCYIDEGTKILPPRIKAYQGLPQGMSEPLFGSQKELGINDEVCYDRINRFTPYGYGISKEEGGLGLALEGDLGGLDKVQTFDWSNVTLGHAQQRCLDKNAARLRARTAVIIRTWSTFVYTEYHIMMLRAMISELALASGGQYTVHFLIHVQDESLPIWADEELYNKTLRESLPEEFEGMGSLWSVAEMKLVYPPPFPDSLENFSGGEIYQAYRSLHFPLQYFASRHPEFDYFWQWEMDMRITGHYHELLSQISSWAEKQPQDYAWERSAKFFIPSLHDNSYAAYSQSIVNETDSPISGPQLPVSQLLEVPAQSAPSESTEITDLITFNPLFDPSRTRWAFHNDLTGYDVAKDGRPPTRAALITASRMSRRLLLLMHEETYQRKHTMFPEMYPASIALHYGLKAIYAPLPVYFDRDWPAQHADEVFNNAPLSGKDREAGMDHGSGYFHGEGGSVFGPGEHVFRGSSYYSNAGFAGYLWRRWLGKENNNDEIAWESEGGKGGGRMCLPMMVLHPVKFE
ncbi:hypothetical protein RBB50_001122 [Rhinocladiella similis]